MMRNKITMLFINAVLVFGLAACNSGTKNNETNMVTITDETIQSEFKPKPDESINFKQAEEHFKKYPERWNTAFKFLTESDLKNLPIGRVDLSDDVYAMISEYETKDLEDANFESHRERIDLQYLISGEELIGLTNDTTVEVITPYVEENDITFYNYDGGKMLAASPAEYFIFFPDDKHKPCVRTTDKGMVRKVVLKIRYKP